MTFAILVFSDPGGSWYSAYSVGKAARRFDSTFKAVGPRCVDDNAAAAVDTTQPPPPSYEPGPEAAADSAPPQSAPASQHSPAPTHGWNSWLVLLETRKAAAATEGLPVGLPVGLQGAVLST